MSHAPIEIEKLTVSYDQEPVLRGIDATFAAGRLTGIVGPNGAGKSTLIKAILGLVPADTGRVRVFGEPFAKARKRVVYVPQRSSVDWDFPVTVRDVVMMGRMHRIRWWSRPSRHDREVVDQALEQVGIEDLAERQISNLSGGQQQRTFLARAIAQEGDVYVMDEPFVGVDAATEDAIIAMLKGLRDEGRCVVVVNHDLSTARRYFDDLLLLNREVIALGPIESVFTAELLQKTYGGRLTFLEGSGGALGLLDA